MAKEIVVVVASLLFAIAFIYTGINLIRKPQHARYNNNTNNAYLNAIKDKNERAKKRKKIYNYTRVYGVIVILIGIYFLYLIITYVLLLLKT